MASDIGPEFVGTTFLVEGEIEQDGVAYALAAYFINRNPMRFQIWRPDFSNDTGLNFELVGQWHVTPMVGMAREDVRT